MRKSSLIYIFLFSILFLVSVSLYAQQENVNAMMNELNSELKKAEVFTPPELASLEKPLKNMLTKGMSKHDLKKILVDLSSQGVKGKDLKGSVKLMNDLLNQGEDPKQVGNLVSRAAHQAQAQGLKGKDLAAKVHAAIEERKMQRKEMKEPKQQHKKHSR